MGNTIRTEELKRTGSKRFIFRRFKEKSAHPQIKKTMDESNMITTLLPEETETTNKCMQNLKDHVKLHEENLDVFFEAQNETIDDLSQLLRENTSENVDGVSQEEIILRQSKAMKSAVDKLKDIQIKCQLPIERLKDSFKDVRSDIERWIDAQHIKQEKLQKDLEDCCNAKRRLEEQVKRLKQVENANKKLQVQNRIPQSETEQAANESAAVQIFYIYESNVIKEIEKELKIMLKRKLRTVNFKHCPSASDIDQKKLLIVLCIVSTRLGADATKAIKDVQNPRNAALLIIHIAEVHTLPNQISSRHLTDQGFRNLRGIFDMSFKKGNGFFQCDMNERSINGLCSFCEQLPFGERL